MRSFESERHADPDIFEADMQTIERLRERAVHCRELCYQAHSANIAAEFERLAMDYESDAFRLEARLPVNRRSIP
jgi:hypothetical protein